MAIEKKEATFCPNCSQPAIRNGNEITCEKCDATFTITKKQGATVKSQGRLDKIDQRLDALENVLDPEPPAEPDDEPDDDPVPENDDDESEVFPE